MCSYFNFHLKSEAVVGKQLQPWPMNLAVKGFVIFQASIVFSVPQLCSIFLPLTLRILLNGQTYLLVDLDLIGGCFLEEKVIF